MLLDEEVHELLQDLLSFANHRVHLVRDVGVDRVVQLLLEASRVAVVHRPGDDERGAQRPGGVQALPRIRPAKGDGRRDDDEGRARDLREAQHGRTADPDDLGDRPARQASRRRVREVERRGVENAEAGRRRGEWRRHLRAQLRGGEREGVRAPARGSGDAHLHHHRSAVHAGVAEVFHRDASKRVADARHQDVRSRRRGKLCVGVQQRLGLDRQAEDDDGDADELPGGEHLAGDEDVEHARYRDGRAADGLVETASRQPDGFKRAHEPDEVGEREEVQDQAGGAGDSGGLLGCLLLALGLGCQVGGDGLGQDGGVYVTVPGAHAAPRTQARARDARVGPGAHARARRAGAPDDRAAGAVLHDSRGARRRWLELQRAGGESPDSTGGCRRDPGAVDRSRAQHPQRRPRGPRHLGAGRGGPTVGDGFPGGDSRDCPTLSQAQADDAVLRDAHLGGRGARRVFDEEPRASQRGSDRNHAWYPHGRGPQAEARRGGDEGGSLTGHRREDVYQKSNRLQQDQAASAQAQDRHGHPRPESLRAPRRFDPDPATGGARGVQDWRGYAHGRDGRGGARVGHRRRRRGCLLRRSQDPRVLPAPRGTHGARGA